ncbi:MAG: GNAT family N-acetyltransferase, partial [Phycisphaerales bacterium]
MIVEDLTPTSMPAVLPRVLEMVHELCRLHEAWDPQRFPYLPDVLQRYERWLPQRAADPRSVLAVARDGDEVLGFLIASVEREIPIYRVEEFLFVHDMYVELARRGQGIGKSLMMHALERARAMKVTQMRLDVARANGAARKLFESCG